MVRRRKNTWAGIVIGPILVFVGLAVIWKNETRYDYFRAASKTIAVNDLDSLNESALFSYTDEMDQSLKLSGHYVEQFEGYLYVRRSAEIYCWDEDQDDEGHTTWNMRWMSSVEHNSRNKGIVQQLNSGRFAPENYSVGKLVVSAELIEFVDSEATVDIESLTLTELGNQHRLKRQGEFFYLDKNRGNQLGDERLQFQGIPTPSTATYFGQYQNGKGIAHTENRRESWINQLIMDSGILHHLVAGERESALVTMKSHIRWVKWMFRFIGTAAVVGGFAIFFAFFVGFMYQIPILGRVAELGVLLLSIALGIPLAAATMVAGYLAAHPLILLVLLLLLCGLLFWFFRIRKKNKAMQVRVQKQLSTRYGQSLTIEQLKEQEFIELWKLSQSDGIQDDQETGFIASWERKQGWDQDKCEQLIQQAKSSLDSNIDLHSSETHLKNLIQLALADGNLSPYEMRTIRSVANRAGIANQKLDKLIRDARF